MAKTLTAYQAHVKKELLAGHTMKQAAASWHPGSKSKRARIGGAITAIRARRAAATTTGANKHMRKKGGHHSGGFNTSKMFKFLRIGALAAPAAVRAFGPGTPQQKFTLAICDYTGFDMSNGTFHAEYLKRGWLPYIATAALTYGIPKLLQLIRRF